LLRLLVVVLINEQAQSLSTGWLWIYNNERPNTAIISHNEILNEFEDWAEFIRHLKNKSIILLPH